MLTADLVRPRLRKRKGNLIIDYIDESNDHWLRTAAELIALFQAHRGKPLHTWDAALDTYEGDRVDYIVVRGLAKVLTDAATFVPITTILDPVDLRKALFARGPAFERVDLFNVQSRHDILADTATQHGMTIPQIEAALFADRVAEYLLTDTGPAWTPGDLLLRYNMELARGALYYASKMTIEIHDSYKDIWKYIKLFKLMFWAQPHPSGDGYLIDLDGPITPFINSTIRYGRQFAAFLPALFLCDRWRMSAEVRSLQGGQDTLQYQLDDTSPLRTHFKRSGLFDSRLEANFAADFEAKFGGQRGQWTLTREDEVILLGDTVMIPDFSVTNKRTGKRAIIEIVGFWHPDYLRRKVEKVRAAKRADLILLVYEGVNLTPDKLLHVPGEVLYFKNKPVLKDVIAAVEKAAR